ncbi:MAG: prepilin peptidase [Deltaproteobacteria bacterium]|nr:prepilin peptidase [Deltaproteobacteria bacterium]
MTHPPLSREVFLLFALLYGLAWGSFLNQWADRWSLACPPGVTWFSPRRSCCFHCQQTIPWWWNLPVVSYLWLGGRCGFCRAPMGASTLVVELAVPAGITALAAWVGPERPGVLAAGVGVLSGLILLGARAWKSRHL